MYDPAYLMQMAIAGRQGTPGRVQNNTYRSRPSDSPGPTTGGRGRSSAPQRTAAQRQATARLAAQYRSNPIQNQVQTPINPFDQDKGGIGGFASGVLDKVITVADAAKQGYQSYAGEMGDLVAGQDWIPDNTMVDHVVGAATGNPFQLRGLKDEDGNRDSSFDFGELSLKSGGHFQDRVDYLDDLPGLVRAGVGFAGDIATDPLTYLTAGTVKATGAAGGAARKVLAQDFAEFGEQAIKQGFSKSTAEAVTASVSSAGRGGLTRKALEKIGTTSDELAGYGYRMPEFQYSVGVGRKARVGLPGTAKLAEAAEGGKGAVKAFTGNSKFSRVMREALTSTKQNEGKLITEILGKAGSSHQAALQLTDVYRGREIAETWSHEATHALKRTGLDKLDDTQAKALTHTIEAAQESGDDVADAVLAWSKDAGEKLAKAGVRGEDGEPLKLLSNYMPHNVTGQAADMAAGGHELVAKYVVNDPDAVHGFRMHRTDGRRTIKEINEQFRLDTNLGFDLLEDDSRVLLSKYIGDSAGALQQATMNERAQARGLIRQSETGLVEKGHKAAVAGADDKAATLVRKLVDRRKKITEKATKKARRRKGQVSKHISDLQETYVKSADALAAKKKALVASHKRLESIDKEVARLRAALTKPGSKSARLTAQRQASTKRITQLEADKAATLVKIKADEAVLKTAEGNQKKLIDRISEGQQQLNRADQDLAEVESLRNALEDSPLADDVMGERESASALNRQAKETRVRFAEQKTDVQAATETNAWLSIDTKAKVSKLDEQLVKFSKWLNQGKVKGRDAAAAQELKERIRTIRVALLESGDDKAASAIASLEAQAAVVDMAAMRATKHADKVMNDPWSFHADPDFQDMFAYQTEVGFKQMESRPGWQIDKDYAARIETLINPGTRAEAWLAANKVMQKYAKVQGWWKAYAVATPGFHMRNMYSGGFGMWLDGVSPKAVKQFNKYYRTYVKQGPEAAEAWALKQGEQTAAQLREALEVVGGSGWGVTHDEVRDVLKGAKSRWYSPGPSGGAINMSREFGETVEASMRGAHAFSVLQRGGSRSEALHRTTKFHFNYRDIGAFDQGAKLAMPFWTFFSRNAALQAQVWARNPGKLNRSFFNAKRNMENISEEEGVVPSYFEKGLNAIRTPWSLIGGQGRTYATPDIPSLTYREQVEDPLGAVLGGINPVAKVALESLSGKNTFTGREYRNSFLGYEDGELAGRKGPIPDAIANLPGIQQILDTLPGTKVVNDQLLVTDRGQSIMENFNPMIGRADRLFQGERQGQALAGVLGVPVRWNDEGSQAGELARQGRVRGEQRAAARTDRTLERLTR